MQESVSSRRQAIAEKRRSIANVSHLAIAAAVVVGAVAWLLRQCPSASRRDKAWPGMVWCSMPCNFWNVSAIVELSLLVSLSSLMFMLQSYFTLIFLGIEGKNLVVRK